jgi:hypothetical protein
MKAILLKTDGTISEINIKSVIDIERIIKADFLDSVDLRDGRTMLIDDGVSKKLPTNTRAKPTRPPDLIRGTAAAHATAPRHSPALGPKQLYV